MTLEVRTPNLLEGIRVRLSNNPVVTSGSIGLIFPDVAPTAMVKEGANRVQRSGYIGCCTPQSVPPF